MKNISLSRNLRISGFITNEENMPIKNAIMITGFNWNHKAFPFHVDKIVVLESGYFVENNISVGDIDLIIGHPDYEPIVYSTHLEEKPGLDINFTLELNESLSSDNNGLFSVNGSLIIDNGDYPVSNDYIIMVKEKSSIDPVKLIQINSEGKFNLKLFNGTYYFTPYSFITSINIEWDYSTQVVEVNKNTTFSINGTIPQIC